MDPDKLKQLLQAVAKGQTTVDEAMGVMRDFSSEDIGFAHIDHHRALRKGFPEVIYGQGKTRDQIIAIMERISRKSDVILATRVDPEKAEAICRRFGRAQYHEDARMVVFMQKEPVIRGKGEILVISAGTSDIPVAREAFLTAKAMGNKAATLFDVGVAGIHRLFEHADLIAKASVLIVVAGMEGALPSVVAGMVGRPVIAVPTSVGYGVSLGGITALFAMLTACSSNVAVVNIDNGFGAGYMASVINQG